MVIQEDEADDLLESVDRSLKQLRYGALSLLEVEDGDAAPGARTSWSRTSRSTRTSWSAPRSAWASADWIALTEAAPAAPEGCAVLAAQHVGRGDTERSSTTSASRTSWSTIRSTRSSPSRRSCARPIDDPQVVAIKMTLYRIGANSPLVDLLIDAAEQGKQVAVLVELKARFDERNNIAWATRLEAAGIHVVYGVVNLKTHCKLCLVVRKEQDGIRRYAHVGTGNYNPRDGARSTPTSGCSPPTPRIVDDVSEVFNYLTGYSHKRDLPRAAGGAGRAARGDARADRARDRARPGRAARRTSSSSSTPSPIRR